MDDFHQSVMLKARPLVIDPLWFEVKRKLDHPTKAEQQQQHASKTIVDVSKPATRAVSKSGSQ